MARYSANGVTPAGTDLPILIIIAATTTRAGIYDLIVSSDAAPADVATKYRLYRGTAVGTGGTAFTPTALDPAEPAALLTAKIGTFSGAPTTTASSQMLEFALNQRATFRWVAAPGSEIIIPATASNWVGIYSTASTATPNTNCTILWNE